MSFLLTSPLQIHNSPLNNSTAKAQYSFPKAKRTIFKQRPTCEVGYYDLPPIRSTRAAGFGFAKKFDFTKLALKNPAPNSYRIETRSQSPYRGFSFGASREQMAITGGMNILGRNSPGPGAYKTDTNATKKVITFTFGGKNAPDHILQKKSIPGPGAYNIGGTISKNGRYFVSKFRDSGALVIAPQSRKKKLSELDSTPGPGAYETKGALNATGTYFNSKFHSSMSGSFGRCRRGSSSTSALKLNSVPGPGSYRLPSEFGHYGSALTERRVSGRAKHDYTIRSIAGASQLNTTKNTERNSTPIEEL